MAEDRRGMPSPELIRQCARVGAGYQEAAQLVDAYRYVDALVELGDVRDLPDKITRTLVLFARFYEGASWATVGDALRIHRSSAQQRFGRANRYVP